MEEEKKNLLQEAQIVVNGAWVKSYNHLIDALPDILMGKKDITDVVMECGILAKDEILSSSATMTSIMTDQVKEFLRRALKDEILAGEMDKVVDESTALVMKFLTKKISKEVFIEKLQKCAGNHSVNVLAAYVKKVAPEFEKDARRQGKAVEKIALKFMCGKITPEQFALELKKLAAEESQTMGIKMIDKFVSESGMDLPNVEVLMKLNTLVLSLKLAVETYKVVKETEAEAQLAYEERLKMDTECEHTLKLIRQYREEMHEVVENYLCSYSTLFLDSIDNMDQALLAGDSDEYLQANNALVEALGGKVQFTNNEEFEEFMESEEDFEL